MRSTITANQAKAMLIDAPICASDANSFAAAGVRLGDPVSDYLLSLKQLGAKVTGLIDVEDAFQIDVRAIGCELNCAVRTGEIIGLEVYGPYQGKYNATIGMGFPDEQLDEDEFEPEGHGFYRAKHVDHFYIETDEWDGRMEMGYDEPVVISMALGSAAELSLTMREPYQFDADTESVLERITALIMKARLELLGPQSQHPTTALSLATAWFLGSSRSELSQFIFDTEHYLGALDLQMRLRHIWARSPLKPFRYWLAKKMYAARRNDRLRQKQTDQLAEQIDELLRTQPSLFSTLLLQHDADHPATA